jgi:hypothetical protein
MSKQDSVDYGLEGFKSFIRNKIKYQREILNFNEIQEEAAFYTDMKTICEEYYADLSLNEEEIIKKINCISNDTQDLIKKRQNALNLKLKESKSGKDSEKPKSIDNK